MSRYVVAETREEFKKLLREGVIIIVKASANWCGPCKNIAPLVKKLFESMPNNVFMLEIDVDEDTDLVSYFKIRSVPTLISYVGNERTDILTTSKEDSVKKFFSKVNAHCFMDNSEDDLSVHLYGAN